MEISFFQCRIVSGKEDLRIFYQAGLRKRGCETELRYSQFQRKEPLRKRGFYWLMILKRMFGFGTNLRLIKRVVILQPTPYLPVQRGRLDL